MAISSWGVKTLGNFSLGSVRTLMVGLGAVRGGCVNTAIIDWCRSQNLH